MTRCTFCDHDNPPSARRCESCGAELPGALEADQQAAASAPRGEPIAPAAPANDFEQQLLSLVGQGRKIEAIKLFRQRTGSGLKEAKDAVEALAARHGIVPARSGCAGMLILFVIVGWIAACMFWWWLSA